MCESNNDGTTLIQIAVVKTDVFRHLLFYMYGGKVSDDDMKSLAKEIIDAAMEVEVCLVNATIF